MSKKYRHLRIALILSAALFVIGFLYWRLAFPIHRIEKTSDLIMLGDLDHDGKWTTADLDVFDKEKAKPFQLLDHDTYLMDMNQNGMIDEEDYAILQTVVTYDGNAYRAGDQKRSEGHSFPRPRELFRYISKAEYLVRPYWGMKYIFSDNLGWLDAIHPLHLDVYINVLNAAIYNEGVRLDRAWRFREPKLSTIERDYAVGKLKQAKTNFEDGKKYESLLLLIELTEDAETLTTRNQPTVALKFLVFRDHLRHLIESQLYVDFEKDKQDWRAVLKKVSAYLYEDLGVKYDFETLGPARNLTDIGNYLQRIEWQFYKTVRKDSDFNQIVKFAQHDPRYLRAVAQTTPKFHDPLVQNHNLPMVLLFREALRITGGDKKEAIGLIDEVVRMPFYWIGFLPDWTRVESVAQGNFLLPGNKEDGADKSRHWNVFGALCLYKMPLDALDLALKREMQDLRKNNYAKEDMREFFRDMIANLNGMYHVMSVNVDLISQ
ncbi:MAG: hypothetical protein AB7S81_00700 [Bdellovibrionales bacterium]